MTTGLDDARNLSSSATSKLPSLVMYTFCAYNHPVSFEWDPRKASANLRKHGVDFADAVIALEDSNALTIEDYNHDEQRFITLGLGPSLNVLLVV